MIKFFTLDNIVTILSLLALVVSLIITFIKAKKNGNIKGVLDLVHLIPNLVVQAESLFGKGNGTAKLNYVLTELRVYALEHNICVTNEELKVQVESVVNATNQVNINKTPNVEINENTANADTQVSTNNTQTNINI